MTHSVNPVKGEPIGPSRLALAVGALSAVGAIAIAVGAAELPDLEQPVAALSGALGHWAYLVVGVFAFFETAAFVGLAVPGETAVLAGGMVAHRGDVELVPLILVVWLAATAGDATSFMIGRRVGHVRQALRGVQPHRRSRVGVPADGPRIRVLGLHRRRGRRRDARRARGVLLVAALLVVRRWIRSSGDGARAGLLRDHGRPDVAAPDRRARLTRPAGDCAPAGRAVLVVVNAHAGGAANGPSGLLDAAQLHRSLPPSHGAAAPRKCGLGGMAAPTLR